MSTVSNVYIDRPTFTCRLHVLNCSASPEHSPTSGGWRHLLDLEVIPVPQDLEHPDHGVQFVQYPPSSGSDRVRTTWSLSVPPCFVIHQPMHD